MEMLQLRSRHRLWIRHIWWVVVRHRQSSPMMMSLWAKAAIKHLGACMHIHIVWCVLNNTFWCRYGCTTKAPTKVIRQCQCCIDSCAYLVLPCTAVCIYVYISIYIYIYIHVDIWCCKWVLLPASCWYCMYVVFLLSLHNHYESIWWAPQLEVCVSACDGAMRTVINTSLWLKWVWWKLYRW